jgi:hypothetical protein
MTRLAHLAGAIVFLALLLGGAAPAWATPPGPMRRIALLVGANDPPPGRQALRFAHDDAQELAGVLEQVGGFATSDVHVLLDPSPGELLLALDGVARATAAAGGDVLFVFYYSGHSDGAALFPHGEPVPLANLRDRVEHLGARIRVGILDTCRGGSWTLSKGLSVGPPLAVADLMNVDTEGTALLSSSSGVENAHEADAVHGSFFTHYLAAGLRGAADRDRKGTVTLQEAFDYARERTVRDSARLAKTPQHPSFDLALRGRQDIVLTVLSSGTSALAITAARGAVEVIQLSTGVTMADAPPASGPVRIALPPGRYLVRSVRDGRVYTKEVEIHPGETLALDDGQLEASGDALLARKGPPPPKEPLSLWNAPRDTRWLLHLQLGVGSDAVAPANVSQGANAVQSLRSYTVGYSLWYRITDRLSWSVPWPALTYRFGHPGRVEVMPYAGIAANSWNSETGVSFGFRTDVSARIWTTRSQWVSLDAGVTLPASRVDGSPFPGIAIGQELEPFGVVGYGWTIHGIVTLSGRVGLRRDYDNLYPGWQYEAEWLNAGASVAVRVTPRVAVDLSGSSSTELHEGLGSYQGFTLGTTLAF